jgi:AcrR family transcriptional regulator
VTIVSGPPSDTNVERRAPFGHSVVGERGGDTRRRILSAALDALGEVGFDELRVELITERARCSRPTFYQYFSSKQDVFWALARELGREMVALAGTLSDATPDRDGVARLTNWVSAFMNLHQHWAPVFSEFPAASLGHRAAVQDSQDFSTQTATALVDAFGLAEQPRRQRAMIGMVAVLMRVSFYAEMAPRSMSVEPMVRSVAELFHRMFCGPIDGVNLERTGSVRRRRSGRRPPLPQSRERLGPKSERTRHSLMEAGLVVLRDRGFRDTSVDDITSAAGVSHGTFYRYFANKEELLRALAEAAAERTRVLLDRLDLDLDEVAMRTWLDDWFAAYASDGGIISIWQERPANPALTAYSGQVAESIYARLVHLLQCRDFGDPTADATTFLALLERLPHTVFTLGFLSVDEGVDTALLAIRRGFLALAE